MSKIKGTLVGGMKFNVGQNRWQGVIVEHHEKQLTVLAVGEELTESEINAWVAQTIALMREQNSTEVQAADMWDRAAPRH